MQAINIFGLKFTRSRVEEPVQPISKDDLADEIQSDSYAESRKRNSSEAALRHQSVSRQNRFILNIS